jgi:peptide/nickel transport system permease protein
MTSAGSLPGFETAGEAEAQREPQQPVARLAVRYPRIAFFGSIVVGLVLISLMAPLIAPYDPRSVNVEQRLAGPSFDHLMGTDQLGRDTFSRVLYGGRTAIPLGLLAVSIAALVGVTMGALAGYFGGAADQVTGRLVDAQLAFPELILAVAVVNAFGANLLNVMLVIGLTSYPGYYRLTRGQVLQARSFDYVLAARALGASEGRIVLRHILPNILSPLLIAFSLAAGGAILLQTTLGFFGLGPPAGTPDWGRMFFDALADFRRQPWLVLGPGLAVSLVVLCFYTLGDALRDALDPALRGRR